MKNLSYRMISALIALIIVVGAIYFGERAGAYLLCLFVVVRGSFEMARMFFPASYPPAVKWLFVVLNSTLFVFITQENLQYLSSFAVISGFVTIASFGVIFHKTFKDLDQVLTFVAKSSLGLVYVCLLPATVAWTIQTNNGIEWFLCLLGVVFAGDIGAYIFGVTMGKNTVAPALSPKKTIQGAVGGLLFSLIMALGFKYFLPTTPLYVLALCGLLGGTLAQIGDFFESLIKRVSGVKDSGSIMPGHGGVLDRLDGVLFAAPLFYFAAINFSL